MMDFPTAIQLLIGNEGGYTVDSGGPTKYGISQRAYPELSTAAIQALTLDTAAAYFRRDYWGPAGCDAVPDVLKFPHFDFAVNTSARGSCGTAIKALQRAAGQPDPEVDGVLGPHTLMAVSGWDPYRLLTRLTGAHISYYTGLRPALWSVDGAGWMNRVARNALRT